MSYITIRILDKDGNPCPNAGNLVKLTLAGPGVIAGTDNGDATDLTSFQSPSRKAFHGMALAVIKSTLDPGDITLTATAEGLPAASVKIAAQP